jgi:hypothetical protein
MRAEPLELRQRWTQRNDSSLIISDVASFDEISRQTLTDVDRRKITDSSLLKSHGYVEEQQCFGVSMYEMMQFERGVDGLVSPQSTSSRCMISSRPRSRVIHA